MQHKNSNKISKFVQEQIDFTKRSVVIVETATGYKVNDFKIQLHNDTWIIIDNKNIITGRYKNKRLAVLIAALTVKKRHSLINYARSLDIILDSLKHDKYFFESKIFNKFKKELFEDRLSRANKDLFDVYAQILELEKSVGLQ